jgi:nucleoporin p58/p45
MFSTQTPTATAAGNTQQSTGAAQPFSGFGQQQSQPTQSLFGNLGQTQQQQPGAGQSNPSGSAGPFGSTAGQPPAIGGNPAFGGSSWNSGNPLLPKSAFGSGTSAGLNQPQQQGTAMFGQQPQQQQSTGFGGSLFGSTQNQAQQPPAFSSSANQARPGFGLSTVTIQQPGAQIGQPLFAKSTKFNDLPENAKKTFEDIEAHIQGRLQISKDLKQRQVGEEATKGQDLIRSMHKDLINSITVLQNDILSTRDLKAKVDQSVQDTIVAVHIIDGFRNPQQHGAHLRNHANFPLEFFTRITDQMRKRLQSYKETIEQIERKLTSAAQQVQHTPQAITATLEAQNTSFIALANKIAALDTDLQRLKALYTQLWRAKTGSMRDPFSQLDRGSGGEFGVESLYGK